MYTGSKYFYCRHIHFYGPVKVVNDQDKCSGSSLDLTLELGGRLDDNLLDVLPFSPPPASVCPRDRLLRAEKRP
jgi:hypothetical protein